MLAMMITMVIAMMLANDDNHGDSDDASNDDSDGESDDASNDDNDGDSDDANNVDSDGDIDDAGSDDNDDANEEPCTLQWSPKLQLLLSCYGCSQR